MTRGRGGEDRGEDLESPWASIKHLENRMSRIIRVGTIEEIDHKKAMVRVKIGGNTTDWRPWSAGRAGDDLDWDPPSVGEQVTFFSPGGDFTQGVAMPSVYQKKFDHDPEKDTGDTRRRKLKDGTVIEHDLKKGARTTTMPKNGTHSLKVDKQEQTVDAKGTRIRNDKAMVDVASDGTIKKVNDKGGVVLNAGGNVYINC